MPDLKKTTRPSVGVVKTQTAVLFSDQPLELESGERLGPITVAYETYGALSAKADNAVLLCHALSGSAHAAGYHEQEGQAPGWWEDAVGPGKAFDTDRYFVISSNVLGGCSGTTGPASLDPATGRPFGQKFSVVTIADMVKVQKALLESLGIKGLLAVAGGSMGGMQALEWALRYPGFAKSTLVVASTARLSAQGIAFNAVGRHSILSDPNYQGGDYYQGRVPAEGLAIARMIGHITYLSDEAMHTKFGRQLRGRQAVSYDFENNFQVESYLDHQGYKFVERFDANSYLLMTKAMDYWDVPHAWGQGSLKQALARVQGRVLILSFSSDWLFPPYQSVEMLDALLQNHADATYQNIETKAGHDAFLLEVEAEEAIISRFLSATLRQA
jgi:homoserine O-acetyltransferase